MISVGDAAGERHPAGRAARRARRRARTDRRDDRRRRPSACSGAMYDTVPTTIPAIVICGCVTAVARLSSADELGQAEVEHLDQAALGAHQVRALDVAVDDAAAVRFIERVGDLEADLDDLADRQRPLRDARRQQLAFDVLHDDEVGAGVLADVVGDGDVRRAQHRGGARLVQQARAAFRIGFERGGRNFSATGRPSRTSSARYTSPMPPAPRRSPMR